LRYLVLVSILLISKTFACTIGEDYSAYGDNSMSGNSGSFTLDVIGYEDNFENLEIRKPSFFLERISRGYGIEPYTSCSDLGFMLFQSYDLVESKAFGYKFEWVSGDQLTSLFPSYWISIIANGKDIPSVEFIWVDSFDNYTRAFDFVVSIKAINEHGEESESQYLRVYHPGN
jgi:hypothetical protein